MIKTGIYGPAEAIDRVRKQLLRLVLRHPDVDLRAVASPGGNAVPIAELHPVYAGETELTLERTVDLDKLDVLFVIDSENLTEEILNKYRNDPDFRLVLLGKCDEWRKKAICASYGSDPVYGLPEYFRKALVRGARFAVSPTPEAMILLLSLLPLASKGMLSGDVKAFFDEESGSNDLAGAAEEASAMLAAIPGAGVCKITTQASGESTFERIDVHIETPCPIALEELTRLYGDAYDDHSFVHIIPGKGPVDEDLRGSNKCLLRLGKVDDTFIVDASMDALTKGVTGNAVHLMNLLFGLLERTGLSI